MPVLDAPVPRQHVPHLVYLAGMQLLYLVDVVTDCAFFVSVPVRGRRWAMGG